MNEDRYSELVAIVAAHARAFEERVMREAAKQVAEAYRAGFDAGRREERRQKKAQAGEVVSGEVARV